MVRAGKVVGLGLASWLCWFVGFLQLGGALPGNEVISLIVGILACYCGFGLRKRQKAAGVIAIVVCGLLLINLLLILGAGQSPTGPRRIGPALELLFIFPILIAVVTHWNELKEKFSTPKWPPIIIINIGCFGVCVLLLLALDVATYLGTDRKTLSLLGAVFAWGIMAVLFVQTGINFFFRDDCGINKKVGC